MPQIFGIVHKVKPTTVADSVASVTRMTRYGEPKVEVLSAGTYPYADEGSYFKAINPTMGTGITAGITTAFSATAGFFNIRNTDSAGGKRIYMDYMTLIVNTAPASATSMQVAVTIDNPVAARYSSAGQAVTPVNVNMDDSTVTIANVHAGAIVLTAASGSARTVARGVLRSSIPIVQDTIMLNFGQVGNVTGTMGGATALATVDATGPIVIGPQQDLNIHIWVPANATTAGVYELEAGWWER